MKIWFSNCYNRLSENPDHLTTEILRRWLFNLSPEAYRIDKFLNGFLIELRNSEDFLAFKLKFDKFKNYSELKEFPKVDECAGIIFDKEP